MSEPGKNTKDIIVALQRDMNKQQAIGLLIGAMEAISWQVDNELRERIEGVLKQARKLLGEVADE